MFDFFRRKKEQEKPAENIENTSEQISIEETSAKSDEVAEIQHEEQTEQKFDEDLTSVNEIEIEHETQEPQKIETQEIKDVEPKKEESKNIFSIGFDALKKVVSKTVFVENVMQTVQDEEEFSEFVLEDMEDLLISADLGVNYTSELIDKLRGQDKIKPSAVREYLREAFEKTLASAGSNKLNYRENELNIYFVVGVNGAGKTTLIGKLANRFRLMGKKVLIAAGDTFRAAAEEQLDIWTKRAGADIVRRDKADAASVVYEAIEKAKTENYDVILVDTAGRLQNKFNLMEELSKIKGVIDKQAPESLSECLLVLDANTGQNGLQQAKVFMECVKVTAVALTKLDGSAKGAIVLAIAKEFGLPVKLIGVGEKIDDLKDFSNSDFINALFD